MKTISLHVANEKETAHVAYLIIRSSRLKMLQPIAVLTANIAAWRLDSYRRRGAHRALTSRTATCSL